MKLLSKNKSNENSNY